MSDSVGPAYMAINQSLPSPASRRHADPSNRPKPPDVIVAVAADTGDAVVTVPGFGALRGLPGCLLSGGLHAAPITPLSATMTGLGTITLHFAEAVAGGDLVTWPERDDAIRGRAGGYVGPQTYVCSGATPTAPAMLSVTLNSDTPEAVVVFDQDIIAAGPTIAGQIIITDADGVQWESDAITDITADTLTCSLRYSVQTSTVGTTTTMNIGAVIVGLVGGLAADEWADEAITAIPAAAEPFIIHALSNSFSPGEIDVFWNVAGATAGGSHNAVYDSGFSRLDNGGGAANFSSWQTRVDCTNVVGASTTPDTFNLDAGEYTGTVAGLSNLAQTDIPCPTEP